MARLPDGWVFIPIMKDAITIELKQMELITCRHCKHGQLINGEIWCLKYVPNTLVPPDWFCGYMEGYDAEM